MQTAGRISEIDLSRVKLGDRLVRGRLPVYYGGQNLVFQTPYLQVSSIEDVGVTGIRSVSTVFSGSDDRRLDSFLQFIENLERRISTDLIGRAGKLGLRGEMRLKKLVKAPPGDAELYIPWPVRHDCPFVRADRSGFNPALLAPGHYVRLIVAVQSFWVEGGACGLTTVVRKVMVYPPPDMQADYDFQSDDECPGDDPDDDIISALSSAATVALAPTPLQRTQTTAPRHPVTLGGAGPSINTDALLEMVMDDDSDSDVLIELDD